MNPWFVGLLIVVLLMTAGALGFALLVVRQRERLVTRLEAFAPRPRAPGNGSPAAVAAPRPGALAGWVMLDFELPSLDGGMMTLSRWRGQRVLVTFIQPNCPYSDELLEALERSAASRDAASTQIVLVSSGEAKANRRWTRRYRTPYPLLLQQDRELADEYEVRGTPSAYLVDGEGRAVSPLTEGVAEVLELAGGSDPHASRGITPLAPLAPFPKDGLAVGTSVAAQRVPRLGGGEIALSRYRGRPLLLVFLDPECAACDPLWPLLAGLEAANRERALVLVSRGDPERTRALVAEHRLSFPIAQQRLWEVSHRFGLTLAPSACLLDRRGALAAAAAIGVQAVLRLAESGSDAEADAPGGSASWAETDPTADAGAAAPVAPGQVRAAHAEADADLDGEQPLVSAILTTRDRPAFVAMALRCYAQQTYSNRELIVVDDGERFPLDEAAVAAVGGRLLRVPPGTPLGTKLNRGIEVARGRWCQKSDDDDWYGPDYTATMVREVLRHQRLACRPLLARLGSFLVFDLARWQVRQAPPTFGAGGTFFFSRQSWETRPFRALPANEDHWFSTDQQRVGTWMPLVRADGIFLQVRHHLVASERDHAWTHMQQGPQVEDYLLQLELYPGGPDALLPAEALAFYAALRGDA